MRRTITPEQYRAVRLKLDLTQSALAEIMSVNVATINRRENGKETITRETSMALEGFYKLETGSFTLPRSKPVQRTNSSIAHHQKAFSFSAPRRGNKAPSATKA